MKNEVKLDVEVSFSSNASDELKSLKPIFEELGTVHERYVKYEPEDDFSFWHLERPQAGLLAAAAWLSGNTALEEYGCDRPKRRGKPDHRGRRDLYIRTSKTAFECEAKYLAVDLAGKKNIEESVRTVYERLNDASKDAEGLGDVEQRLGLCFAAPWISESGRGELDKRSRQLIRALKRPANGRPKYDALVWLHSPEPFTGDKRIHAGLLLIVKETKGPVAA